MKQFNFYSSPTEFKTIKLNVLNDENKKEKKEIKVGIVNVKRRTTVVGLYDEETLSMTIAATTCCPKDQFEKKIGKKIATGKAMKNPSIVIENIGDSKTAANLFIEHAIALCTENNVSVSSIRSKEDKQLV